MLILFKTAKLTWGWQIVLTFQILEEIHQKYDVGSKSKIYYEKRELKKLGTKSYLTNT